MTDGTTRSGSALVVCAAGILLTTCATHVLAGQDAPTFERPYDGVPSERFAKFDRIVSEDQINSDNDEDRSVWPADLPPRFTEDVVTPHPVMNVGFAYFGQFIDHDLDLTREVQDEFLLPPFVRAAFQDENGNGENRRTAGFDLDSVYGFGPLSGDSGITQGAWFDSTGLRFRFGAGDTGRMDFLRNILNKAKIGDPRNDVTGLTGQVHRSFMQLHNMQVNRVLVRDGIDESTIVPGDAIWAAVYHEARNYTTAYYQGLAMNEYAPMLTGRSIVEAMNDNSEPLGHLNLSGNGDMPIEFAAAMYRLHTTIPQTVQIGEGEFVSPIDPIMRDGIDWMYVFGPKASPASALDCAIAADMRDIVELAIPGLPISITLDLGQINVMRGRELRVPSGEEYLAFLLEELGHDETTTHIRGREILTPENAAEFLDPKDDAELLADLQTGDTDFWVYMSLEAKLNGGLFGPVGQDVLERVWAGLMLIDPYSVFTNEDFTQDQLDHFNSASYDELLTLIPRDAVLTDMTLAFGTQLSGDLDSIRGADDSSVLKLRSVPGFLAQEPNVIDLRVGFEMRQVDTPEKLDLYFELALNQPGGVGKVAVKNWQSGAFEEVGAFLLGLADENIGENTHVIPFVDASDRVRKDGRIELQLKQVMIASFTASGFDSTIDQVRVDVYE